MSDEEKALEEEIMADARRRAERIERRAERDAEGIREDAEERAEQERERLRREARRQAEEREQRIRARTQQDVAALHREARHEILEQLRDRAKEELAALTEDESYRDVLTRLALKAIERMEGDSFELALRDRDREEIGQELTERIADTAEDELDRNVQISLSGKDLTATGGLVLRDLDGRRVADQTFEGRMDRLWKQIREELAEMLPDLGEMSR